MLKREIITLADGNLTCRRVQVGNIKPKIIPFTRDISTKVSGMVRVCFLMPPQVSSLKAPGVRANLKAKRRS
jgi:hypothetical protein